LERKDGAGSCRPIDAGRINSRLPTGAANGMKWAILDSASIVVVNAQGRMLCHVEKQNGANFTNSKNSHLPAAADTKRHYVHRPRTGVVGLAWQDAKGRSKKIRKPCWRFEIQRQKPFDKPD